MWDYLVHIRRQTCSWTIVSSQSKPREVCTDHIRRRQVNIAALSPESMSSSPWIYSCETNTTANHAHIEIPKAFKRCINLTATKSCSRTTTYRRTRAKVHSHGNTNINSHDNDPTIPCSTGISNASNAFRPRRTQYAKASG